MRVPILFIVTALACQSVPAASLSDADREALLDNLEKIRESADTKVDSRLRLALAAYKSAAGSDDAAIDLYLNCMEKVNFEERNKKASDFREWKRKQSEKLSDAGMRLALRHQLQWLILTLQAAPEKADRTKLAADAREALQSTFRDLPKMRGQNELLSQSVLGSPFALAYDVNTVKVRNWPVSPIAIQSIYEELLFPLLRGPRTDAALREAWLQRIQQEGMLIEAAGEEKRGLAGAVQSPEMTRFLETTKPQLEWQMEVDLFQSGDQSGAALRMLAHLQKYIGHPAAREWGNQFKTLLKPEASAADLVVPE